MKEPYFCLDLSIHFHFASLFLSLLASSSLFFSLLLQYPKCASIDSNEFTVHCCLYHFNAFLHKSTMLPCNQCIHVGNARRNNKGEKDSEKERERKHLQPHKLHEEELPVLKRKRRTWMSTLNKIVKVLQLRLKRFSLSFHKEKLDHIYIQCN